MAKKIRNDKKAREKKSFFTAFKDRKLLSKSLFWQTSFIFLFSMFTIFILVMLTEPLMLLVKYLDSSQGTMTMLDAYRSVKSLAYYSLIWLLGFVLYLLFFEGILWYKAKQLVSKTESNIRKFLLTYCIVFLAFFIPFSIISFFSLQNFIGEIFNDETFQPAYFFPLFFVSIFFYFLLVSAPNIRSGDVLGSIRKTFVNGIIKLPYYLFLVLSIVLIHILFVVLLVQVPMYIVPLLLVGLMMCLFLYRMLMIHISN